MTEDQEQIKMSPAQIAEKEFIRLCQLEDKEKDKFLAPNERVEKRWLRRSLREYFMEAIKSGQPYDRKDEALSRASGDAAGGG